MKETYIKKINTYFRKNKYCKNKFLEQLSIFDKTKDIIINKNNYNVGDEVCLNEYTLIHGSRINIEELNLIKEKGLISSEFYSEFSKWKKKPYVVEFWDIKDKILLKDFINIKCGVTVEFKDNSGKVIIKKMISMDSISETIKNTSNYRDYIIYQNQEQRFIPNKFCLNGATMAFIISDYNKYEIFKNDIFLENYDKKILKAILPKWFYKKYFITRSFDNYETGREKAILFGIPSNLISGILISEDLEKKEDTISKIKEIFPDVYICNVEGKILSK